MKLVMIGAGYVGLVTGTFFVDSSHNNTCVDLDAEKTRRLNLGEIPIYKPGLVELVKRNSAAGRLHFTKSTVEVVSNANRASLTVGTPQRHDGSADLSIFFIALESIAPHLAKEAVVFIKSTVPVGTNAEVARRTKALTGCDVDVASNLEFLKEEGAIDDFTKPVRVVVGVSRPAVGSVLHELDKPFLRTGDPFLVMNLESLEMTKYVANCLLATKISFINEMANICEKVGADINDVRKGIGHDQRIGFAFLFPGVGFGGSCFPKDVRALINVADQNGIVPRILHSVYEVNEAQKEVIFQKLTAHFQGHFAGKTVAIRGLAFNPQTDDIREAPSLVIVDRLLEAGAKVRAHDPLAMDNVRKLYGDKIGCSQAPKDDPEQCCPDITKAKTVLCWSPTINLSTRLSKTVEYYQSNVSRILI